MTCTTDGNAPGLVTISSVGSDNSVALTCVAPSTAANCTHSNGMGQTYTNCNDALGFDSEADARDAMFAYLVTLPVGTLGGHFTNNCAQGDSYEAPTFDSSGTQNGFILWFYTGLTGQVITYSGPVVDSETGCTGGEQRDVELIGLSCCESDRRGKADRPGTSGPQKSPWSHS